MCEGSAYPFVLRVDAYADASLRFIQETYRPDLNPAIELSLMPSDGFIGIAGSFNEGL